MEIVKPEQEIQNPLSGIKETVERITQNLALESKPGLSPDCAECRDTGIITRPYAGDSVIIRRDGTAAEYTVSEPCECRIQKIIAAKLPAEYAGVSLATLEPRQGNHPNQAEVIKQMQADPGGSFIFSGDFGAGKSHFFWALCIEAIRARKKMFAGTLRALIDQYHKSIEASQRNEVFILPIYPDDLRSGRKCALFLDDLDKARPTEYVAEQLFELLDAAVSNKQQVVATTNLSADALIDHFQRADSSGRFGGSIVRRLLHNAHYLEMF